MWQSIAAASAGLKQMPDSSQAIMAPRRPLGTTRVCRLQRILDRNPDTRRERAGGNPCGLDQNQPLTRCPERREGFLCRSRLYADIDLEAEGGCGFPWCRISLHRSLWMDPIPTVGCERRRPRVLVGQYARMEVSSG